MGYVWRAGEGVWGGGGAECVRGWSDAERWSPMQMDSLDSMERLDSRDRLEQPELRGKVMGVGFREPGLWLQRAGWRGGENANVFGVICDGGS